MRTLELPQDNGENQAMRRWVERRIPGCHLPEAAQCMACFEPHVGIKAVVAFFNFRDTDIEVVFASDGPWASRDMITTVLNYPFQQLGVNRVTALIRKGNKPAHKLVQQLGFKREGKLRRADTDGTDLVIYGLLPDDYRLLRKPDIRKMAA